ncbi:MAG: phosphatidate cytidylyltransferase [Planctomycetes bacterium]|nr:phosphatidate cytidylyltransferase [Planctomycetota bacterium]
MKVVRRIIFGLALLGIFFGLLYLDHINGNAILLSALILVVVAGGSFELSTLFKKTGAWVSRRICVLGSSVIFALPASAMVFEFRFREHDASAALLVIAFAACVLLSLLYYFRTFDGAPSLGGIFHTIICFLLIPVTFFVALSIRVSSDAALESGLTQGEALLLLLFASSRGGDIFAYFVGRFLGRHKAIPAVSPGKTIEGCAGGLLGSAGLAVLVWSACGIPRYNLIVAALVGLAIGFAAQLGDLLESAIKRSAGEKDSGNLVPEFGGVLDMVDNFILSAPVAYGLLFFVL